MPNKQHQLPELPECVQMKHRIQQELDERYRGLSQEERRIQMEQDILANPILGPLVRTPESQGPAQAQSRRGSLTNFLATPGAGGIASDRMNRIDRMGRPVGRVGGGAIL